MGRQDLLSTFIGAYPAQPATAFWRAIEIGALAASGIPPGLGLDLGCGDGILTDILLGKIGSRRLVGVDPDPCEAAAARHYEFYDRIHSCGGDAIPESDSTFDFVISNSVLEHIPLLEPVIAEVSRVLKVGGKFFFTVPGRGFHDNLSGSLFPHINRERYLNAVDRRLAHFHYLSPEEWIEVCARHSLVVEECKGYLNRAETQRWETLSRLTGGLFYSIFGERQRPIEIQRRIGARSLQNRWRLPPGVSTVLGRLVSLGVSADFETPTWIDISAASCLLVQGRRS
jgi:SAM-dependent methyltransferase